MAKLTIRYNKMSEKQRKEKLHKLGKKVDPDESLKDLLDQMKHYEEKYNMSTLDFYAQFITGKMGDGSEVIKWAGAYDQYMHIVQTYLHKVASK